MGARRVVAAMVLVAAALGLAGQVAGVSLAAALPTPNCLQHGCESVRVSVGGNGSGWVTAGVTHQIDCRVVAGTQTGSCVYLFSWFDKASTFLIDYAYSPDPGSQWCSRGQCDDKGQAVAGSAILQPGGGVFTLRADYDLTKQTLTVAVAGSGSGVVASQPAGIDCPGTCTQTVAYGTGIVLTATATAGSYFAGWTGPCSGTKASCVLTLRAAAMATADFERGNAPTPRTVSPALSPSAPTSSPAASGPPVGGSAAATPTDDSGGGLSGGGLVLVIVLAVLCGGLGTAVLVLLRRGGRRA